MQIELANSPESNPQLLKRILRVYGASILHVFGFSLLLSLMIFLPRFIALAINLTSLNANIYNFYILLINVAVTFIFTAMLWRIRCVIANTHEKILDDFSIAIKKIILIMGAAIIHFLIIASLVLIMLVLFSYSKNHESILFFYMFAGFCILYIIATIFINFLLSFYLPVILTEDQGIFAAIKKSVILVWGNWWRVFLLQIITPVCIFVCLLILDIFFPIGIHLYFSNTAATAIGSLVNLLILAIFIPFYGATLLVQLRDLELRKAQTMAM